MLSNVMIMHKFDLVQFLFLTNLKGIMEYLFH